jgi:hypothetical protein
MSLLLKYFYTVAPVYIKFCLMVRVEDLPNENLDTARSKLFLNKYHVLVFRILPQSPNLCRKRYLSLFGIQQPTMVYPTKIDLFSKVTRSRSVVYEKVSTMSFHRLFFNRQVIFNFLI